VPIERNSTSVPPPAGEEPDRERRSFLCDGLAATVLALAGDMGLASRGAAHE
jgi:hypothetical protein